MEGGGTNQPSYYWRKLRGHFREAFSTQFVYHSSRLDPEAVSRSDRKRGRDAYLYILLLLAVILTPILIHDLYRGQALLAGVSSLLLALVLVNILLLSRGRQAFLSPTLLLLLNISFVFLAVSRGQSYSLYWLYPLLVALPVLLRPRRAMVLGVLSGLLIIPLTFRQFDQSNAVVISVSMGLTWLVSAWLVFAVNEQARRLTDMAITDPLTGAYNRRYLQEQARQAIDAWRRDGQPAAILLMDIDYFKRVNDKFGHSAGDLALQRLVELISGRVRSVDTVCRFGGEEFLVLLHATELEGAMQLARKLRMLVEQAPILAEGGLTISIGVCEVAVAESLDHWFKLADNALYLAKRNGRNRVEHATPESGAREPETNKAPNWR